MPASLRHDPEAPWPSREHWQKGGYLGRNMLYTVLRQALSGNQAMGKAGSILYALQRTELVVQGKVGSGYSWQYQLACRSGTWRRRFYLGEEPG